MKVEWKRERPSRAVLEVELPAEDVAREVGRAAARLARRVRVPGFRPGKAPRTVLERYIGRDELYGEAAEQLVSSGYRQAVADVGMLPVGRPEFDVQPLDEAKPLQFVARVDVSPEVDPGAYDEVRWRRSSQPSPMPTSMRRSRNCGNAAAGWCQPRTRQPRQGDFVLIRPSVVEGLDRFQVGREVLVELGDGVFPEPARGRRSKARRPATSGTVTVGETAEVDGHRRRRQAARTPGAGRRVCQRRRCRLHG